MQVLATLAAAVGLSTLVAVQDTAAPPERRELEALTQEFFALDHKDAAQHARGVEILARVESVPTLDARARKKWDKAFAKLWSKGEKLPKESGRHFLWEDEERGLYYIGGNVKSPKGLVIGMHGGGVGSGDASRPYNSLTSVAKDLGWVGIFPEVLEKTETGWTTSGTEEFVLELVERARRTWKIDADQVFFTGHSMGGYGTWTLGAHHADLVAALAPSAGAPTPVFGRSGGIDDVDYGVIPNLRNVPMVIYQSLDDRNVPPAANQAAVGQLKKAQKKYGGYDFEYWEVDGRGHSPPPGGMKALLDKIKDHKREARPEKLLWQPVLPWKRQFYWLFWETPESKKLIEAELDRAANTVRIKAKHTKLRGLYILADEDLFDFERDIIVEKNGEEVFRGRVEPSLRVLLETGATNDPGRTYTARIPVTPDAK
jgi:poly(3-hydroxybutyrate) depolymerase